MGRDGVIPGSMEWVGGQLEIGDLFGGGGLSGGIFVLIQLRSNLQSGRRRGVADELNDRCVVEQRSSAPIARDVAEHPVFDLVPFARSGRKVSNHQLQSQFTGQFVD